ncbi:MAG: sulfatase [Elusimicrobiota bacterium]
MKIKRAFILVFCAAIVVFGAFYLLFIIPDDRRIPAELINFQPWENHLQKWYDFTEQLPRAVVTMPNAKQTLKLLNRYPYKETNPSLHTSPLNMHISLGWFPMKTVHRDCIVAAESIVYPECTLPDHASLSFDYGIISSINRQLLGPVRFKVIMKGRDGHDQVVFDKTVEPIKPYRWQYFESFYKNIYKYLYPRLEERDSRWESISINLDEYSRGPVRFAFIANGTGDVSSIGFWGQPQIHIPVTGPAKKNVMLIVIDSMRADHLVSGLSPYLIQWSRRGVVFKNALSNGNMTKLSVSSFLSSRYPFEMPELAQHYDLSQADKNTFYARHFPTLPGVLKKQGYRTAQIGSVSLFSAGHGFSADMGFDESWNLEHSGYSPPHVTDSAIDWLEKHGQEPFFLMVYYEGPHGPYRPPLRYLLQSLRLGIPAIGRWWDVLYRGEILYHDAYLARLREYLVRRGLDKNTTVIITADHGVAFRSQTYDWPEKYGPWKKKKVSFHSHGVSVTPEDLHVPLIIIDPQWPQGNGKPSLSAGSSRKEYVQLLDLAPTIVSMCGGTPPRDFHGNSLVPLLAGKPFDEPITFHQGWLNYGIYLQHRYLYIRNTAPREGFPPETVVPEELYDIQSDPLCLDNRAGRETPQLISLRRQVRSFVRPARQIRLGFSGAEGQSARLMLTVYDPQPRTFAVEISSGEYKTMDVGDIRKAVLSGTINGRKISAVDILAGRSALPLETDCVLSAEDLDLAGGWPDQFAYLPRPRLVIGVIEKDIDAIDNSKKAPQQLKSMLEQWGYIH